MLKLATIGSSWITEQFLDAAVLSKAYTCHAIYSRNLKTATLWAKRWNAPYAYDNLQEMYDNPEIDVIYIASPNSLHFEQAMQALHANKHVIVEKPIITDLEQWNLLQETANKNYCFIFEAARHIHGREFRYLKNLVHFLKSENKKPFLGANFVMGQYSSRYDQYLENLSKNIKVPNVFSPDFAGGTMMDLSIYPLYLAVALFGTPESGQLFTVDGPNGIDLVNQIVLRYSSGSLLNIFVSKSCHSLQKNEIYFGDQTLVFDSVSEIGEIKLYNRQNEVLSTAYLPFDNPLLAEANTFAKVMKSPEDQNAQNNYNNWQKLSKEVHRLIHYLLEKSN